MTQTKFRVQIMFWHDDCADSPCEEDGWTVYSFGRRHSNYKDPYDLGFGPNGEVEDENLLAKMQSGLAFTLSYFEHGNCIWSLRDELPPGANCRWDSVGLAGLLVWEGEEDDLGPKTREDRMKDARGFVERFTEWCNGEIFGYSIKVLRPCHACGKDEEVEDEEHDIDTMGCGGFYASDVDYMIEHVKESVGDEHEVVFVEDQGYGLADRAKELWKGGE